MLLFALLQPALAATPELVSEDWREKYLQVHPDPPGIYLVTTPRPADRHEVGSDEHAGEYPDRNYSIANSNVHALGEIAVGLVNGVCNRSAGGG